jgi:hypothetical protein
MILKEMTWDSWWTKWHYACFIPLSIIFGHPFGDTSYANPTHGLSKFVSQTDLQQSTALGRSQSEDEPKLAPEICAILGNDAEYSGNYLPTFRENQSFPSSRVKMGTIGCPERSVRDYHYLLRNFPKERRCVLLWGGSFKSRKTRPSWIT